MQDPILEWICLIMAHNTNQGRRISSYGIPRPHTRGPRPRVWKSGPDPTRHQQFRVWGQQKNQAQWREEGWDIAFDTRQAAQDFVQECQLKHAGPTPSLDLFDYGT